MNTLFEEISMHLKACAGANKINDYWQGMTELEYHIGKIIDRLLIATGHGRMKINVRLRAQNVEDIMGYDAEDQLP